MGDQQRTARRRAPRAQPNSPEAGVVVALGQQWTLGEPIGEGGFGRIFAASSDNTPDAVAKFVDKLPGAGRELLFDLPEAHNVLPVIDRGEWGEYWVLVMPRAEKCLRDHMAEVGLPLAEPDLVAVLKDIVGALVEMAGDVVHRDLKPENVLFWQGRWCVADFGIARYAQATTSQATRKYSWTPPYAAPEQWRFERATIATDVYALGVIAFELAEGRRPFAGPGQEDFREQHLHGVPPDSTTASPALRSLIAECLAKTPEARPTPEILRLRLDRIGQPLSPGLSRLQEAHAQDVRRTLERQGEESAAASEERRRAGLFGSGERALNTVINRMAEAIRAAAPSARLDARQGLRARLGLAELVVGPFQRIGRLSPRRSSVEFDVVGFATVAVAYDQVRGSWLGRSHAVWYCDALQRGSFRLCEIAFMKLTNDILRVEPFALGPDEDALLALSPTMHTHQVAWDFTPIDQGEEQEFIDRWLGWFADASSGGLQRPSQLPEHRRSRT